MGKKKKRDRNRPPRKIDKLELLLTIIRIMRIMQGGGEAD